MNCIFEPALPNSKPWIFGFAHTYEGEGRILGVLYGNTLFKKKKN